MKRMKKTKRSGLWICFGILILLGIVGGVLIKLGFYEKTMDYFMSNREANRLISYLGIRDYEYTDRLGSKFTVAQAKQLLEKAEISEDKVTVSFEYKPNFLPLTVGQFEALYENMITELELDRLSEESLYIYEVDNETNKVIDGVAYELVRTNNGDYYMEKEYAMDNSYMGKVVKVYVSNNEIILCQGESKEQVSVSNAYMSKVTEEDGEKKLLVYVNGSMKKLPLSKNVAKTIGKEGFLCDLSLIHI